MQNIYYKFIDNYTKNNTDNTATITIYNNNKMVYKKTCDPLQMLNIIELLNALNIKQK